MPPTALITSDRGQVLRYASACHLRVEEIQILRKTWTWKGLPEPQRPGLSPCLGSSLTTAHRSLGIWEGGRHHTVSTSLHPWGGGQASRAVVQTGLDSRLLPWGLPMLVWGIPLLGPGSDLG